MGPALAEDAAPQVRVTLARLNGWLERFAARHGAFQVTQAEGLWHLAADDGSEAQIEPPNWAPTGTGLAALADMAPEYAVVIVRRAGYAVGRFSGRELLSGRASSRHIHGRTAAGGWSQQRYARRRANQAAEIVTATVAAADALPGGASSW